MRFDKRKIHRTLFDATERYSQRLLWGSTSWNSEEVKIVSQHQSVWWKENGLRFGICLLVWLAFIITLVSLKPYVIKPVMVALVLTWMFAGIAALVWGFSREKRKLTVKELEAILPILDLTPIQKAYAECLLSMEGIGMSSEEKDDLISQLNRLLDEEATLISLQDSDSVQSVTRQQIAEERDVLAAKLAASTDEVSRQAFAKGLEICDRRLAAAADLCLTDERVDAQMEMIRQAMCGVRDSLRRLRLTPSASIADLNLDHLSDSVFLAHRQTEALESAVAEVRAISR